MTTHKILETQAPTILIHEGRAVTNSRDVATVFDKEHFHVLRDIGAIITQAPGAASKFGLSSYLAENGKQERCYEMDRDGFSLLAMGFVGPKALQFKLQYIEAFNAMEAALVKGSSLQAESAALVELVVERLRRLENPAIAAPDHFTALGFAVEHKLPHDKRTLRALGLKASQLSRWTGAPIQHVHDSRYGHIGSYAKAVLLRAAKELRLGA